MKKDCLCLLPPGLIRLVALTLIEIQIKPITQTFPRDRLLDMQMIVIIAHMSHAQQ